VQCSVALRLSQLVAYGNILLHQLQCSGLPVVDDMRPALLDTEAIRWLAELLKNKNGKVRSAGLIALVTFCGYGKSVSYQS